uniref:L1 transposable element RRM domain-containing protein n=1 Tax=Micrurus spixii TaxID=129469 RepID=A0A2D4MPG2_9SAUR
MQKMEERGDQTEKKVGEIDNRLTVVEQDKGKRMIALEMDKADFYLRFQNVERIMTKMLAEAMEISKEKTMDGIDEVFQVYTRYAMRHKLPREVHVRFTKKTIKKKYYRKQEMKQVQSSETGTEK